MWSYVDTGHWTLNISFLINVEAAHSHTAAPHSAPNMAIVAELAPAEGLQRGSAPEPSCHAKLSPSIMGVQHCSTAVGSLATGNWQDGNWRW